MKTSFPLFVFFLSYQKIYLWNLSLEEVILLQSIFSAIAVYISTSIDYLFILLIIFSQSHTQKGIRHIFYQEKATTKKKGSHLVALPFKVDGKVVFFE